MNILVVEDNEVTAEALAALFSLQGHAVARASNGREGLAALTILTPDVILLDLLMPNCCGFKFLTALRSDPEPARALTPVLVMTAAGDDDLARLDGVPGPLEVFRKPADPAEIVAAAYRLAGADASSGVHL